MSDKKKNRRTRRITRREFIKKAGMAGAAVGVASTVPSFARRVFAAKRDHILIGHPNPSTGPLAGFGEASPWADEQAIAADHFQKNLKLITPAVSLGGVETIICSPALTSHAKISPLERAELGITDRLLRLSVGIEVPRDLIADIEQALIGKDR